MAKSIKKEVVKQPEAIEVKQPENGLIAIIGTGVGSLEEGKEYHAPKLSAEHLINVGHATKK